MTVPANYIEPVLTDVGLDAAIAAGNNGIDLQIDEMRIGAAGYTPDSQATALLDERLAAPVLAGQRLGPGIVQVISEFSGGAQFSLREVGFYSDGVLIAVWSSAQTPLMFYTPDVPTAIGFILEFRQVPADVIGVAPLDMDLSIFFAQEFIRIASGISANSTISAAHEIRLNALEEQVQTLFNRR